MASAKIFMTPNSKLARAVYTNIQTRRVNHLTSRSFIYGTLSSSLHPFQQSYSTPRTFSTFRDTRHFSAGIYQSAASSSLQTNGIDRYFWRSSQFAAQNFNRRFISSSSHPLAAHPTEPPKPSTTESKPTPILQRLTENALPITKHENIYTLPNFLTFTRLLSAPAIGYFILTAQPVAALSLFTYAAFTDLLDGWLARRFNSFTVVGSVIDPMADKTLMTVATVCLYISGTFPWWLALVVLGRDVGLAISAIYFRWISLPPPKTMTRYWDFSLPSAEVKPTEISKINTLLQLLLVGNAMVLPVLPAAFVGAWNLWGVFEGWQYLVASTTVWSGLSYVGSKDAVRILSQEEGERKQEENLKKLKGALPVEHEKK